MKTVINGLKTSAQLLKIETMTMAGRVNLGAIILLVIFILAYTANDFLSYAVSAVRDAVKTWILKTNIYEPYQSESILKIIIPIILLIVFCLLFLYINERQKKKIDKE